MLLQTKLQNHSSCYFPCLDTRLLASGTEVIPEVEECASDIVSTKSVESDLWGTSLERNTKHGRDDEGAVGSDGGRPSENSSGFLRREKDTNGTESSSVHETGAKEKIEEQEDEPSIVLCRIGHLIADLDKVSLCKGSDGTPNDGNHCHLGSSILVGHDSANRANNRSDKGSKPGNMGAIGSIWVGVGVIDFISSATGFARCLVDVEVNDAFSDAAITRQVAKEIDNQFWKRTTVADEGTEAHDV